MMSQKLLLQLGWLFDREAARLRGDYEWPPKDTTPEEQAEAARLDKISSEIFERAQAIDPTTPTGTDYVFDF